MGFTRASPTEARATAAVAEEEVTALGTRTRVIMAEIKVLAHPNEMVQVGGRLVHAQQQWTCNSWAHIVISIDLTDAYWRVPIARLLISYLGFRLGAKAYAFRAMPFGLKVAPRIFPSLADAVVKDLRLQGILIAAYLDHWLVRAPSETECLEAGLKVFCSRQSLGFGSS